MRAKIAQLACEHLRFKFIPALLFCLSRLAFGHAFSNRFAPFLLQCISVILEIWRKFFEACDLPTKIQDKYAESFVSQRIQPNMLIDLDKETLRELGVDALGDQVGI
jgi:hypothetical protein